jgi:plasmid stabilization system protein ParE
VRLIWSPRALERVVEIGEYIAQERPNAAARWVDEIFESVTRLRRFPSSGRAVPESTGKTFARCSMEDTG